jgi:hypothetical protein
MRKLIIFGFILFGTFILVQCKKREFDRYDNTSKELTAKFFTIPSNAPGAIFRIAATIKSQNDKYHFLQKFISEQGTPEWQYSFLITNSTSANTRMHDGDGGGGGGGGDSVVFIPLVKQPFRAVHGFLACIVEEDKVFIRLFDGSTYETYGLNKGVDTLSAALVAATTMYLHYRTFGDSVFSLTDTLLMKKPGFTGTNRKIIIDDHTTGRLAFPINTYACLPVTLELLAFRSQAEICYTYTQWIDVVDPELPTGTQIPTGGGSGGWWNENPCRLAESIDGATPCGGGDDYLGFVPTPISPTPFYPFENLLGPYVSSEDEIIVDNWKVLNIDTTELDSCRKIMLNKMLATTHQMGRFLAKLDRALGDSVKLNKFTIKYKIDNTLPFSTPGHTVGDYNAFDKSFDAVIRISDSVVKRSTDLFLSQTIFHETIHAYLTFIIYRLKLYGSQQNINLSYGSVFDEYVDSLKGRNVNYLTNLGIATYQHNYMADHLLQFFANSLAEFDEDRINDPEYYWYIAWAGLVGHSNAWTTHWPNWSTLPITSGAAATDNSDKQEFSYALTQTRLANIHNAAISEHLADNDSRGKKPAAPGSGNCYQ